MDGFESSALAELLANKGSMDPMAMLAMMNKDQDGAFGGNGILILLLIILFAGGGFGLGGRGVADAAVESGMCERAIASQTSYNTLMEAINTNGTRSEMALNSLATTLNCDVASLKTSMCGLSNAVAMLDGKVGYMAESVKNSIQSCCCTLQNAICGVNSHIDVATSSILVGQKDIAYNMQAQFAQAAATNAAQFCEIKQLIVQTDKDNQIRQLQNEIDRGRQAALLSSNADILAAVKLIPTSCPSKV